MKASIQKSDFTFLPSGHGHYHVTYKSPKTGREYRTVISHMPLIDATKNTENPKIKDLNHLKTLCKA